MRHSYPAHDPRSIFERIAEALPAVMIATWIIFAFLCVVCLGAHAREPLPTIVMRHAPAPDARALPAVVVGDGPMCVVEPIVSDPPTRLGVILAEPATRGESIEVATQIARCSRDVQSVADPFLVLALLRLESELGVPTDARGILGAAWCWEAAMRPAPRSGDAGASHGPFQMQAWIWGWCGLPRVEGVTTDVLTAATCYWSRAQKYLDDGKCPGNVARAEAMVANGPAYAAWGCKARSKHWAELTAWRAP